MKKDKIFFGLLIIFVLLFGLFIIKDSFFSGSKDRAQVTTVVIGGISLLIEIAETEEERRQGLSNRVSLDENSGMLFIFGQPSTGGIWMKDMRFPIDIIWIDENYSIIDIKHNAQPESFPEIFYPQTNAKYVLEVNAGFTKQHDIFVGDQVQF